MHNKLTLTYGVRYELFSPLLNHQNALSNFTAANGGGFVQAAGGDWYERSLVHPDKNDFAPRFGFSYQADEQSCVARRLRNLLSA